uniref:NADH-ubiquinone oxidoreductase chain 4L n=1 Tax=Scolytinae sp. BMNH 1274712 TaxID=1796543 RepID=A0A140EG36_9CUCU|nr:NADH dehydrogenase subunit 4L [Scolytinae sp. BMNH 1274712]
MYMMGLISFCMKRKHLLLMLLSLEFIMLSLYMGFMLSIISSGFSFYFGMILLSMGVCEGVVGLSILISLMRSHGNDLFSSYNCLW